MSPIASHRLATVQIRVDTGVHLVEEVRLVRTGRVGGRACAGHVTRARMVSRTGQSGGAGGVGVTRTGRVSGTGVMSRPGHARGARGGRIARTRHMMAGSHMRIQLLGRDGRMMTVRQVGARGRKTASGPRGATSIARTAQTTAIYFVIRISTERDGFGTGRPSGGKRSLTAVRVHTRVSLVGQVGRMRTIGVMAGSGQASAGGVLSTRQATAICHKSSAIPPRDGPPSPGSSAMRAAPPSESTRGSTVVGRAEE